MVLDPFSALLSNGLGWAMEYFEPLREMLDELAGIPDRVAAHARPGTTCPAPSRPWPPTCRPA